MTVSIAVQSDGESVLLVAAGSLTSEELLQANRAFFSSHMEAFRRCRTWLSDYSEASLDAVSREVIEELAYIAVGASRENRDLLVALIVPRDLPFGLARMWEALSDGTGWKTKAFRSEAEAREWLEVETSARRS